MHYPIDIKRSLKTGFTFRICTGLSAKCRILPAKGAIESFAVVGMDIADIEILYRVWMLRLRCLISGALGPFFM
jgi:hypothetical protein